MPLWRILTAIFCLFAFPHIATASTVLAPPDTSSPYATMRSFDSAVVELRDAFNAYRESRTIRDLRKTLQGAQRITRLFDLDPLPPATRDETGRESVSLIMDILNRIPPYDMNAIPGAKAEDKDKLPARWTIPNTEIHIARTEAAPMPVSINLRQTPCAVFPPFMPASSMSRPRARWYILTGARLPRRLPDL